MGKDNETLLLEELRRLHELYLRQRTLRSERINFFVGLSTAIGSGLAILAQIKAMPVMEFRCLTVFLSGLLSLLGVVVYRDLITSDINSALYLKGIDFVKLYFTTLHKEISPYLIFPHLIDGTHSFIRKGLFRFSTHSLFIQILSAAFLGGAVEETALCLHPALPMPAQITLAVGFSMALLLVLQWWGGREIHRANKTLAEITAQQERLRSSARAKGDEGNDTSLRQAK